MSTISASTTTTTAFGVTADTTGALVFQTGASPTTALTLSSGQVMTLPNDASISGLTVGKGYGSGTFNTVLGISVLNSSSLTGNYNTGIGYGALNLVTTGSNNTGIGNAAGGKITTGSDNIGIGVSSLGYNAASTTGSNNVAVGDFSLTYVSSGGSNSALGHGALQNNTIAANNTAVGYQAGYSNATGSGNFFAGYQAGYNNAGSNNTFIGYQAGYAVNTYGSNTFIGSSSGSAVTTGYYNTILGSFSGNQGGLDIRTATNYIVLSDGAGNPRGYFDSNGSFVVNGTAANAAVTAYSTSTNQAFWGKSTVSGSPTSVLWNSGTSGDNSFETFYTEAGATLRGSISFNRTGGLVSYNQTSDYRAKTVNGIVQNALSKVALLKPSTGRMNGATQDIDFFVAHELQEVVPSAVTGEKDAVNEDGSPKYQMVDKSAVIPLLTAAIQELKTIVDAQAAEIAALKAKA
jgi:hypothetical protein